jgi:glycine/D-amino acid oxidase-like deaminating enzyme
MVFSHIPSPHVLPSLADVWEGSYWLDDEVEPEYDSSRVVGNLTTDLLIVGGGFTGLWAAIEAKEHNPDLDVVLVEGNAIARGASGQNGGFVAASLTHGFANGLDRWPNDIAKLVQLGQKNLNEMEQFVIDRKIDCDWMRVGEMDVATEEYQVPELQEFIDVAKPA